MTRNLVYVAVWNDGSKPNKAYTRFHNANKSHALNDDVSIYRHKKDANSDYSDVPNEDSILLRKKSIPEEYRLRQISYMKGHYERYICVAYSREKESYKTFTRMQNLRIFCKASPDYAAYRMLRRDWEEHGKLHNEEPVNI